MLEGAVVKEFSAHEREPLGSSTRDRVFPDRIFSECLSHDDP
jgi:hypothetical protein